MKQHTNTNSLERDDKTYIHHQEILAKIKGLSPIRTAVVHPADPLSLKSAILTAEAGIIEPILVGPEHKIRHAAEEINIDIKSYTIVPTLHSHAAAAKAVQMVNDGEIETLIKGKLHTDELMHAILNKTNGLYAGKRLSHVAMVDVPNFSRPLFITDAAININPNLAQKIDITQNAIDLYNIAMNKKPLVAILSAIETVNENIPSTLDATALAKMSERGQITNALVDGPLAFDSAISEKSAKIKEISSQVAGKAEILVTPNLEAGNILLKELILLSNAHMAGLVVGAKVPIILTSRASSIASRQVSCALALLKMRN